MTTTRPLADLMAEQGLRLRQGLNEVLEGWDELGAEESDDDSNGGESCWENSKYIFNVLVACY